MRALPFLALILFVTAAARAEPGPVKLKAEPFPLTEVRLRASPFQENMLRDKAYLLSLDADRLLHNFRVTAGLPSRAEPLGGWEKPNCELRGHSVGHYLSAVSLMYASTGDEALKQRADYLVAELAKCQEAMPSKGYNKGFLSAYPEEFFDRVDAGKKVWAPYYTLHKIMAGLFDANQLCGNAQALAVLEKMADWLKFRVDRLSHEQMQKALNEEHGGMNEVLANLYALTGKPDHLKLAQAFNHEAVLDPLAQGVDKLDGLHANTQIPKVIGAARQYELDGDTRLRDIAKFFWQRVALARSWVIGGNSDAEHFFPIAKTAQHLSPVTAETCNTYNMLKLTRHLFAWEPSGQAMDFYERGLYNQILASQAPDSGMMTYFVSLKPAHFKVYSTPLDSFWCCVGTGMENHAKYGDTIYFHSGADSLYVNLFIPSELTWKERGVTVRQETKFPDEGATMLTMNCARPALFALKIRQPAWAPGATISVNGQAAAAREENGYLTINRIWRTGDRVSVTLPMHLHLEPLPDDPNTVAVLYGPLVLAAKLVGEGLPPNGQEAKDQQDLNKVADPAPPVLSGAPGDLLAHIAPAAGGAPNTFRITQVAQPGDVTLVPFHRIHHERYVVYWKLAAPQQAQNAP